MKKIIIALLCLLLTLALMSCGSDGTDDTTENEVTNAPVTDETEKADGKERTESDAGIAYITYGDKTVGIVEGKLDYYRATEGKTELPEITVKPKCAEAEVDVTDTADGYSIKVTSADGTNQNTYLLHFVETKALDRYNQNTWLIPYWESNVIYHESALFVGEDGAPLIYEPEHILSVRSCDLKTEYIEGVDYEIKDGKIYRLDGSRIPKYALSEFYPASKETSVTGSVTTGTYRPFVLSAPGVIFQQRCIFVTYTHKGENTHFEPVESTKLHKFIDKLENGSEVNIVFYGDSITAGSNATGTVGARPQTPMWTQMVTRALRDKYPKATINYTNTAVGGKETNWAITELEKRVNSYSPDLVVLAFGMNDGSKTDDGFASNIKKIIDGILAKNPDCEIAVVSTMLPNEETTVYQNQYLFENVLINLAKKYEQVDVVPMTSVHKSLLERKRFYDMSSNNHNHPSDFLVRIYAQTILEVLAGGQ